MSTLTRSAAVRMTASVVGALLVLTVVVSPAGAATPAKKMTKSPVAGYLVTATVTTVQATVTLPPFTCKAKTDAVATELAVLDSSVSETSGVLIGMVCSSKKVPIYGAQATIDGVTNFPDVTMNAEDTVEFSVTCGAGGTTVTIDDTTSDSTGQDSSVTASACSAAFVGDVGFLKGKKGTSTAPLPVFNAINYHDVTINSATLASFGPVSSDYFEGKKNTIATSSIQSDGTDFVTVEG